MFDYALISLYSFELVVKLLVNYLLIFYSGVCCIYNVRSQSKGVYTSLIYKLVVSLFSHTTNLSFNNASIHLTSVETHDFMQRQMNVVNTIFFVKIILQRMLGLLSTLMSFCLDIDCLYYQTK